MLTSTSPAPATAGDRHESDVAPSRSTIMHTTPMSSRVALGYLVFHCLIACCCTACATFTSPAASYRANAVRPYASQLSTSQMPSEPSRMRCLLEGSRWMVQIVGSLERPWFLRIPSPNARDIATPGADSAHLPARASPTSGGHRRVRWGSSGIERQHAPNDSARFFSTGSLGLWSSVASMTLHPPSAPSSSVTTMALESPRLTRMTCRPSTIAITPVDPDQRRSGVPAGGRTLTSLQLSTIVPSTFANADLIVASHPPSPLSPPLASPASTAALSRASKIGTASRTTPEAI
mmetsp:Transcript_28754/g.91778  ORF Transcript_28754/g.91778 Transcript_28754/m.91778 type:complete len:292 (-) Transcript_28754:680-1555(-)